MSLATGTITGVQLVGAPPGGAGAYKTYLLTVSFPAYTGASDSATITGVAAAISAHVRNGKTMAMVAGAIPVRAHAGLDTSGQAVYIGTCTISTNDLTFNLTDSAQTELTSATASQGCGLLVPILES
jgi:hypothetical protein